MKLTIDNQEVEVSPGTTILEAAQPLGIAIPTLCHRPGGTHESTCMVCAVRECRTGAVLPACTARAEAGMVIATEGAEVERVRRSALELLLSEHAGDCEAPCRQVCATGMDVPAMLHALAEGNLKAAAGHVYRRMALPLVLGWLCDAPCERVCRRDPAGGAVEIRLAHRFIGESGVALEPGAETGKRIAVVGGGLAGLSAASLLRRDGHGVVLYERSEMTGGRLREAVREKRLPAEALSREILRLRNGGVEIRLGEAVDEERLQALRRECDAVILACGEESASDLSASLLRDGEAFKLDECGQTVLSGVFACGAMVTPGLTPVQTAGRAADVAAAAATYLRTGCAGLPASRFNARLGPLQEGEMEVLLARASASPRPERAEGEEFTAQDASALAARCLHCECRDPEACRLRTLAEEYGARQSRFGRGVRKQISIETGKSGLVFESGKCIACGICSTVAREHGEALGMALQGRGYGVTAAPPFGASLDEALSPKAAAACAEACPTAALSIGCKTAADGGERNS